MVKPANQWSDAFVIMQKSKEKITEINVVSRYGQGHEITNQNQWSNMDWSLFILLPLPYNS